MEHQIYFNNYYPMGDIMVIAICVIIFILIGFSYVRKSRSFLYFIFINVTILLAAAVNIIYHIKYMTDITGNYTVVYILRILYHALLFSTLLLYVVYITEVLRLEISKKYPVVAMSVVVFIIAVVSDIIKTMSGKGYVITSQGLMTSGKDIFLYGYLGFIVIILYLMIVYRKRLYKRVMNGFYGTMLVSFFMLVVQNRYGQTSYTVSTFLFPTIAMLYIIHSNPYDIEMGAIDIRAMEDMIRFNYERKNPLIMMSLYLAEFDGEGKTFPVEIQGIIRKFAGDFFKGAVLFKLSNGNMMLVAKKKSNPDFENKINKLLNAFEIEYNKFKFDYKIIFGESVEEVSRRNEYVNFLDSIYRNMDMNTVHMIDYEDVVEFNEYEELIEGLEDIYRAKNLRDPRVLVYCQPVFNIKTGRYDTAEALMRLKLNNIGMVYPDKFIPLAEEKGYIHVLTEIILQKTCDEIKYLIQENYDVRRISVNVSVMELKDDKFCDDISGIIKNSGIPDEKVAIEITETQTESDFLVIKSRINELKEHGIKFYLDDFGTGYSNMERIMELPFDIIKFDRSLVLASGSDDRSEKMVGSLANMFKDLDYSVLYEGVENDSDEEMCINMAASYLQGYKYSKPIPIIDLKNFFSKSEDINNGQKSVETNNEVARTDEEKGEEPIVEN